MEMQIGASLGSVIGQKSFGIVNQFCIRLSWVILSFHLDDGVLGFNPFRPGGHTETISLRYIFLPHLQFPMVPNQH